MVFTAAVVDTSTTPTLAVNAATLHMEGKAATTKDKAVAAAASKEEAITLGASSAMCRDMS